MAFLLTLAFFLTLFVAVFAAELRAYRKPKVLECRPKNTDP